MPAKSHCAKLQLGQHPGEQVVIVEALRISENPEPNHLLNETSTTLQWCDVNRAPLRQREKTNHQKSMCRIRETPKRSKGGHKPCRRRKNGQGTSSRSPRADIPLSNLLHHHHHKTTQEKDHYLDTKTKTHEAPFRHDTDI